jgi:hypothetical protein
MGFLDRFGFHSSAPGSRTTTGAALDALAASNEVVAGEVDAFRRKRSQLLASGDTRAVTKQAERSAQLLSGYGIAVDPAAFESLTDT